MEDSPVAIVTGGAQGLGAAICEALLNKGYRVCVADVLEEKGKCFVKEKQNLYGAERVMFSLCDVSNEINLEDTFKETLESFRKLDVLVNNAAVITERDPKAILSINLLGVLFGCQLAFKYMGKRNGGKGGIVISTASTAALIPSDRFPMYSASKCGIVGLTRSYGSSYHLERDGIIFAAICPSAIETNMYKNLKSNIVDPEEPYPLMHIKAMTTDYAAGGVLKILDERINGSTLLITIKNGYQYIGYPETLQNVSLAK